MNDIQINEGLDKYLGKPVEIFDDIKTYANRGNILEVIIDNEELSNVIAMEDCCFFKLCSLRYDDEYPQREAFENVLSTADNPSFNFVYLISGNPTGIDIHIGAVKNFSNNTDERTYAYNHGKKIEASFKGNFQGSSLKKLSRDEIQEQIINPMARLKRTSIITGIPSVNKSESGKEIDFQGIDRLINIMSGVSWRLMVVCEPVEPAEVQDIRDEIYLLYEKLHRHSKRSFQYGDNSSESTSESRSNGDSRSKSIGANESHSSGKSEGGSSSSQNSSESKGTSQTTTEGHSTSESSGKSSSTGISKSMTVDIVNKKIQETLKYLDEELLERMRLGSGKGLFKAAVYAMTENYAELKRLESSISSIFQGDGSSFSPICSRQIDESMEDKRLKMLCNFQSYKAANENISPEVPILYGSPVKGGRVGLSTYLTARELSIISGIPMKEVPGLELREGVEFGLNICRSESDEAGKIALGSMIHRGQVLENNPVYITKDSLNKHLFVAGVTGSGKTTTCQKLLAESGMPFWVIEPAKTEYRELFGMAGMNDMLIFTIGNEKLAPFRFNPFEILQGESISSHVDMLKATFTTAFPMEASMPQILEEAIYECYRKYGWDIDDDSNRYSENPWQENGLFFPTLSDLVQVLAEVVKVKNFGQELQANYIGSLVSRISNLTVGSKGRMLNCKLSVDFSELIDKKVVFEMDCLKSPEDKALLMGLILSRLSEAIKIKHKRDKGFRHITLVEEAHRLLSKVEYGDSGSKKVSVEMFTDMLAEVRKYGESLVIVDQIPNKLAVEVLKNTNTKIIHKLFARDDKEAIGDTMLMDDRQKEHLSSLKTGEAVVFSEGWNKPVLAKVAMHFDEVKEDIDDEFVKSIGDTQKKTYSSVYYPWFRSGDISDRQYKTVMNLREDFNTIKELLKKSQLELDIYDEFDSLLNEASRESGVEPKDIWRQLAWNYSIECGIIRDNTSKKYQVLEGLFRIYDDFLSKRDLESDEFLKLATDYII